MERHSCRENTQSISGFSNALLYFVHVFGGKNCSDNDDCQNVNEALHHTCVAVGLLL